MSQLTEKPSDGNPERQTSSLDRTTTGLSQRRSPTAGQDRGSDDRLSINGHTLGDHSTSLSQFLRRLRGEGRVVPTPLQSAINCGRSSVLNVLLIFIPLAWAAHWDKWDARATFSLSFVAIIPLEKMFDWAGEQLALYCGPSIGDLVIITMQNAVEATLAIILLIKCRLRLLQATIIGVVLLHLLLIPGTAFLVGGARLMEQHLNTHVTQLNHSLLSVGVMTLLIPAAFFAATFSDSAATLNEELTRETTHNFLTFSRGFAIILLVIYVGSRIFLHNPPGDDNALQLPANAPEALRARDRELAEKTPKLGPFVAVVVITITITLMAITAEFLVESIEAVIEESHIKEEFIGLILLPIVSFSADACIATIYFVRRTFFLKPAPPDELAKSRAIDLSIQFTLFWMPFFVLLAWWTHKPLTLLFDLFEVAIVIGACLLVNYITADSRTNWAEGMMMICFYVMIALTAWFYEGQPLVAALLNQGTCFGKVLEGAAAHETGGGTEPHSTSEGALAEPTGAAR